FGSFDGRTQRGWGLGPSVTGPKGFWVWVLPPSSNWVRDRSVSRPKGIVWDRVPTLMDLGPCPTQKVGSRSFVAALKGVWVFHAPTQWGWVHKGPDPMGIGVRVRIPIQKSRAGVWVLWCLDLRGSGLALRSSPKCGWVWVNAQTKGLGP
ncbi:hypothetical protein H0E87_031647, partial [Populus deltoides]